MPERSHYFDAGIAQVLVSGLEAGLSAYYKIAQDLIDDEHPDKPTPSPPSTTPGENNEGLEVKLKYSKDGVIVYGNLAWARQVATQFSSNQYLIDLPTYDYALTDCWPATAKPQVDIRERMRGMWSKTG